MDVYSNSNACMLVSVKSGRCYTEEHSAGGTWAPTDQNKLLSDQIYWATNVMSHIGDLRALRSSLFMINGSEIKQEPEAERGTISTADRLSLSPAPPATVKKVLNIGSHEDKLSSY